MTDQDNGAKRLDEMAESACKGLPELDGQLYYDGFKAGAAYMLTEGVVKEMANSIAAFLNANGDSEEGHAINDMIAALILYKKAVDPLKEAKP